MFLKIRLKYYSKLLAMVRVKGQSSLTQERALKFARIAEGKYPVTSQISNKVTKGQFQWLTTCMLTVPNPNPLIRAYAVDQYPDFDGSRIIPMISL